MAYLCNQNGTPTSDLWGAVPADLVRVGAGSESDDVSDIPTVPVTAEELERVLRLVTGNMTGADPWTVTYLSESEGEDDEIFEFRLQGLLHDFNFAPGGDWNG